MIYGSAVVLNCRPDVTTVEWYVHVPVASARAGKFEKSRLSATSNCVFGSRIQFDESTATESERNALVFTGTERTRGSPGVIKPTTRSFYPERTKRARGGDRRKRARYSVEGRAPVGPRTRVIYNFTKRYRTLAVWNIRVQRRRRKLKRANVYGSTGTGGRKGETCNNNRTAKAENFE